MFFKMFLKQRIQFGLINILYIKKKAYISLVFLNLERKFKVELKKNLSCDFSPLGHLLELSKMCTLDLLYHLCL